MAKEEYIMQLAALDQEVNKFQEQMQMLEQQSNEIQSLQNSLEELEKSKEKTIYANLGKNIFIKTEIIDKTLLVDVGNRTFVKKGISETLKNIEEQILKIKEARRQILLRIQEYQQQMQAIVEQAEKEVEKEE